MKIVNDASFQSDVIDASQRRAQGLTLFVDPSTTLLLAS